MKKDASRQRVLFLVGATATGKTDLALSLARKIGGEIISADSMQVYRGMNIGTDKPPRLKRGRIPHHLIDILKPSQEFSVSDFRSRALKKIAEIHRRGKWPIVAGGTGLYVKALAQGLSPQPGKDEAVRARFEAEAEEKGNGALHARLRELDAKVAGRIHPNDRKRIIRALEVIELSGRSMADWEKETVSLEDLGYRVWIFGVQRPREEIYESIDRRVDAMMRKGLLKEAKRFAGKKLSLTAERAIGYSELWSHLRGEMTLEQAVARIKLNTRHYAKRQFTWFSRQPAVHWVEGTRAQALKQILAQLKRTGGLP